MCQATTTWRRSNRPQAIAIRQTPLIKGFRREEREDKLCLYPNLTPDISCSVRIDWARGSIIRANMRGKGDNPDGCCL